MYLNIQCSLMSLHLHRKLVIHSSYHCPTKNVTEGQLNNTCRCSLISQMYTIYLQLSIHFRTIGIYFTVGDWEGHNKISIVDMCNVCLASLP